MCFLLRISFDSGFGGWGGEQSQSASLRLWPEGSKVGQSHQVDSRPCGPVREAEAGWQGARDWEGCPQTRGQGEGAMDTLRGVHEGAQGGMHSPGHLS